MILFTGGVSASVHAGIPPPRADTPPQEQTPPGEDTPPRADTPQEQTPPGEDTPPRADTPLEADSGIRSMSGWYASYWNAFLFGKIFAENCMKMKEIEPRGGAHRWHPLGSPMYQIPGSCRLLCYTTVKFSPCKPWPSQKIIAIKRTWVGCPDLNSE